MIFRLQRKRKDKYKLLTWMTSVPSLTNILLPVLLKKTKPVNQRKMIVLKVLAYAKSTKTLFAFKSKVSSASFDWFYVYLMQENII